MQLREYTDKLFEENGMHVDPTIEVDSAHMVAPMVENNFGIGIVPKSLVKKELEENRVFEVKLDKPLPNRKVIALVNKDFPIKTATKTFIKEMN